MDTINKDSKGQDASGKLHKIISEITLSDTINAPVNTYIWLTCDMTLYLSLVDDDDLSVAKGPFTMSAGLYPIGIGRIFLTNSVVNGGKIYSCI